MTLILGTVQDAPIISMARQILFRFSALCFLDPKAKSWEQLSALHNDPLLPEAAEILKHAPEFQSNKLGQGEYPLSDLNPLQVLQKLPPSPCLYLEEFQETFGLLVSNACPPYETEYIPDKFSFQRSNTLADINGYYQAFGLTSSELIPERSDHIVQELEFMAFLIGLERHADEDRCSDQGLRYDICHSAHRRFLREHLLTWVPTFARLLFRHYPNGFFASAGRFLSSLLPVERAVLNLEPNPQFVIPSAAERPDDCEGCQLIEAEPNDNWTIG